MQIDSFLDTCLFQNHAGWRRNISKNSEYLKSGSGKNPTTNMQQYTLYTVPIQNCWQMKWLPPWKALQTHWCYFDHVAVLISAETPPVFVSVAVYAATFQGLLCKHHTPHVLIPIVHKHTVKPHNKDHPCNCKSVLILSWSDFWGIFVCKNIIRDWLW